MVLGEGFFGEFGDVFGKFLGRGVEGSFLCGLDGVGSIVEVGID